MKSYHHWIHPIAIDVAFFAILMERWKGRDSGFLATNPLLNLIGLGLETGRLSSSSISCAPWATSVSDGTGIRRLRDEEQPKFRLAALPYGHFF